MAKPTKAKKKAPKLGTEAAVREALQKYVRKLALAKVKTLKPGRGPHRKVTVSLKFDVIFDIKKPGIMPGDGDICCICHREFGIPICHGDCCL